MRALFIMAVSLILTFPLLADIMIITPVNVIRMSSGEVVANQSVVISNGKITKIGPADNAVPFPDGTRIIDGENSWLIPGLAEMHAHVPSKRRGEQYARDMMALFLTNGVTTIRGMLGEPWHLELRQILDDQAWPGPRLVTSGPSFNGNSVSSPQQAAMKAREQAAAGYDFLKLHPGLKPDEFAAIVKTAREVNIPFAGHVSYAVGLDAALREKQDTIDHLDGYAQAMVPPASPLSGVAPSWFGLNLALGMDPQTVHGLAASTVRSGVWNVPTQSLFETTAGSMSIDELLARPGMDFVSSGLLSSWRKSFEDLRGRATEDQRSAFLTARRSLIKALQDAGAGLLLGSDAPQIMNVPGFSVHQELAFMVAAGLTPLQALQAGTINVAKFFEESERGEIAPGFVADLLLLRHNPLENIEATTGIIGVMRAGTWYERTSLDDMLKAIKERGI